MRHRESARMLPSRPHRISSIRCSGRSCSRSIRKRRTTRRFARSTRPRSLGLARIVAPRLPRSPVSVMGIEFPNPVGLAAGLDKNAAHLAGLATLGFGFLEVGTVTPRPQPGNPKPRMFRLREAEALINRLGFNNDGVERFVANVEALVVSRRARHQSRQELRHAECARRGRLRQRPARRVRARELRHREHLVAEHRGAARPAVGRNAARRCSRGSRPSRKRWRRRMAATCRWPSRSRRTSTPDAIRGVARLLVEHRNRRRDRDEHDDRPRRGRRPGACRRSRADCPGGRCSRNRTR